jgi:hypothetical protein
VITKIKMLSLLPDQCCIETLQNVKQEGDLYFTLSLDLMSDIEVVHINTPLTVTSYMVAHA